MSSDAQAVYRPYIISPLPLCGVEVRGIDLRKDIDPETVAVIKRDVAEYRLVLFRDQGVVSGHRQVDISRWFGELDCPFHKHPASPHPEVFRVSNDEQEGCVGVGRTGWHIDGSFQECPYSHSIYHIISVPSRGDTVFTPLHEVVQSLSEEQSGRWRRLFMVADRRGSLVHPLIYTHPLTGKETLCFHTGMVEAFVWDHDSPEARRTDREETEKILAEIHNQIVRDNRRWIYSHKWREGDFIISDNLAMGHEASPDTQLPRSEVGLRVMHRTTIRGTHTPRKTHRGYAISENTTSLST